MAVMSLFPYLKPERLRKGVFSWVFDDERAGLKAEAFVAGMSEMITLLLLDKGIPKSADGFKLSFSDTPFDHDAELYWCEEEVFEWEDEKTKEKDSMAGNWYTGIVADEVMEGWLCPALLLYFQSPPDILYVKAEALPEGIDPIWYDAKQIGRRYVGA